MMSRFFKWLGAEANARAVATLLALGSAFGVGLVFVWTNLVVPQSPELGTSAYAEGYRAAKRITELELRVLSLEERLRLADQAQKIREEVESMTDEEIKKELTEDARPKQTDGAGMVHDNDL